ncbi:hypothetical protein CKAH01_13007 [Colletotrichum kahawae]|uniref:Uncharacterized protein n=1 Tax=Colletotrichum kahawae TaxID=34407 RepID=A0AAD9YS23_COLKA|nr:hypothetical protein CKAH01_13007 [Colletotrichum kahawae]
MSREVDEMENVEMRRGAYSARRAEATVEDSVPRCTYGTRVNVEHLRAGPRAGRELNGPVQVQGRSRFTQFSSGTLC